MRPFEAAGAVMGGSKAIAMVKTTKITVETESLTIIRRGKVFMAWCPDCQAEVEVITLANHGTGEGILAAQLDRWLAAAKLHVWAPASGPIQICLTSLLHCFEPEEVRPLSCPGQNNPPDPSRRNEK